MSRRDRVTEVLIRARARITDKRRWMRFSRATAGPNGDRRVCLPGDPRAERWCALGAVEAVVADQLRALTESEQHDLLRLLGTVEAETSTARISGNAWRITLDRALYDAAELRLQAVGDVIRTNDRLGHAAVLALFDAAIRDK